MKLTGILLGAKPVSGSVETDVTLRTYGQHMDEVTRLKDKVLDIEIKPHREKRSTKANALCWELCSQIGRAITPPIPKEEVYRRAIKAVGEYDQYYIREEALDSFMATRKLLGVGWFAEVVGDAPLRGFVEVFAYIGSSAYDTKAMSTLIDYLVDEAEEMDLQIAYDLKDIEQIKNDWASELAK